MSKTSLQEQIRQHRQVLHETPGMKAKNESDRLEREKNEERYRREREEIEKRQAEQRRIREEANRLQEETNRAYNESLFAYRKMEEQLLEYQIGSYALVLEDMVPCTHPQLDRPCYKLIADPQIDFHRGPRLIVTNDLRMRGLCVFYDKPLQCTMIVKLQVRGERSGHIFPLKDRRALNPSRCTQAMMQAGDIVIDGFAEAFRSSLAAAAESTING